MTVLIGKQCAWILFALSLSSAQLKSQARSIGLWGASCSVSPCLWLLESFPWSPEGLACRPGEGWRCKKRERERDAQSDNIRHTELASSWVQRNQMAIGKVGAILCNCCTLNPLISEIVFLVLFLFQGLIRFFVFVLCVCVCVLNLDRVIRSSVLKANLDSLSWNPNLLSKSCSEMNSRGKGCS